MYKRIIALFLISSGLILLPGCKMTSDKAADVAAVSPSSGGSSPEGRPRLQNAGQPGSFDFYLLNLSWSPEFCHSHPTAAECAAHPAFVLHGLWPENNDGSYPEDCSNAPGPADPTAYKDIYPDPSLLAHEWQTHGTCSGLSADAFFKLARTAYQSVKVPPTLSGLTTQESVPPSQIIGLFTSTNPSIPNTSVVVSCGNNYLTAVEVCLDKNLHPTGCGSVRACRANTVRIPPPGQ